ncbi:MAG: hypothetical protein IPJ69_06335 [Deltaproteobacteria bacterium]|nr:MAG: hypothetical protein IPJ69_06335 [Deltaproteobacteria bacterium]
MGLDIVLPDTQKALHAEGLGILARVGIDALIGPILGNQLEFSKLTTPQQITLSSILNTCLQGGRYLEERAEILLRRSALFSQPTRRDSLTQVGEAVCWIEHEVIQLAAILGALHLCAALGIKPRDSIFSTALSIALSEDIAAKLSNNMRPHPCLDQRKVKRREIEVYTGYSPITPNFTAQGISEWRNLLLALPLFKNETLPPHIHQQRNSLQIVRESPEDPLRGVVLFVVDTRIHLKALKQDKLSFLKSYFSEEELRSGFGERIRKLDDNPVEQAGKVADIIEIKKAIWTFLTGQAPLNLENWNPHEIQLSRDPITHLAAVSLSPRLERKKEELSIGDIRMTWTDQGYISTGLISFRHRDKDPLVVGTGIDITDIRYYWRHEEGHWVWANAKKYFSPEVYRQRYGEVGKPTASDLATRHAVSEAIFKALYPFHPQHEHSPIMYQQFGQTPPLDIPAHLELLSENLWAAQQWGAKRAQIYSTKIGNSVISVASLHKI